jgi:two-component system OmpR family sensor kinase
MTLRNRVRALVLGTVVVSFLLAGTIIAIGARRQLVDEIDRRLDESTGALIKVGAALGPEGTAAQLRPLATISERNDVTLLINADGSDALVLPRTSGGTDQPLPDLTGRSVAELRADAGRPFTVDAVSGTTNYRVMSDELGDGVLVVASPLDEVRTSIRDLLVVMVLAAGGVLAAVSLAIAVASRRALAPLDEMIEAADAIGAGNLSERIPTSSDVPETKLLGEALNNMLRQLEESFVAREASEDRLRRFVADASHELRTPLTSIRGYSELYLAGVATDDESVEKAMRRINAEAQRTGELVNDLLLLAKLDQGRPMGSEPVSLSQLVEDSVADLRAAQPDRRIDAEVAPGIVVAGDEPRLRQVVANVLANTRVHAGDSPVRVSLSAVGRQARLVVADEGPGLTESQASHIFERFWRAEDARHRATGGSGLGLSIVERVIAAHGGETSIVTAPGKGLAITATIPLGAREEPEH